MKYTLQRDGGVSFDGSSIPSDPANRHWIEYQEWLREGNMPDPSLAMPEPLPNILILGINRMSAEDKVKLFNFIREGLKNG